MGQKRIKIYNIADKQLRVLMHIGKLQKYISYTKLRKPRYMMKKLGSEKDIHSGSGLFKQKLWSRQIFKKGMAYFLCFVLLVGSMQGISCAEGNLEEIAERIESEEQQSVSHDSENEQSVSSEEGISSVNEEEAGNQAENGGYRTKRVDENRSTAR